MENQSVFRKHDLANIIKVTIGVFFLVGVPLFGFIGFNPILLAVLIGAIVFTLSFYVPILIARKIISENNIVGRSLFGIFFGMLLFAVIAVIASILFGTDIL